MVRPLSTAEQAELDALLRDLGSQDVSDRLAELMDRKALAESPRGTLGYMFRDRGPWGSMSVLGFWGIALCGVLTVAGVAWVFMGPAKAALAGLAAALAALAIRLPIAYSYARRDKRNVDELLRRRSTAPP